MQSSLAITLRSLNLTVLTHADVSALTALQRDWERHSERMSQLRPEHAISDRTVAYLAFLNDPSAEKEQRLAVLADERLTAKRYALLHEAHAQVRRVIFGKAAGIVDSALATLQQTLRDELNAQEELSKKEGHNKRTDDRCIELREALAQVTQALKLQDEAINTEQPAELSPLSLATILLPCEIDHAEA